MESVRKQYNQAKDTLNRVTQDIANAVVRISTAKETMENLQSQLKVIEEQDKANKPIFRAIDYANLLYSLAKKHVDRYEKPTVSELNSLIEKNFERMFDSKDKYAKLDENYQVRLYYRSVGGIQDYEEENISVGERVSLNFAYIVSILELAKQRKEQDNSSEAVLSLPLVLDAPFSNLSKENTGAVASRLPEFSEQVIIFMLDKDLEASGLEQYTDRKYCYRVMRDFTSNNSTIVLNDAFRGGDI